MMMMMMICAVAFCVNLHRMVTYRVCLNRFWLHKTAHNLGNNSFLNESFRVFEKAYVCCFEQTLDDRKTNIIQCLFNVFITKSFIKVQNKIVEEMYEYTTAVGYSVNTVTQ